MTEQEMKEICKEIEEIITIDIPNGYDTFAAITRIYDLVKESEE